VREESVEQGVFASYNLLKISDGNGEAGREPSKDWGIYGPGLSLVFLPFGLAVPSIRKIALKGTPPTGHSLSMAMLQQQTLITLAVTAGIQPSPWLQRFALEPPMSFCGVFHISPIQRQCD